MEQKKKVLLTFILLIAILAGFWFISKAITTFTGYSITEVKNLESFTKCLSEKSELYVSNGCPHCAAQEKMFGEALKYLKVIDCTDDAEELCIKNEIRFVPTWIISGEKYVGEKSIKELAELSRCGVE